MKLEQRVDAYVAKALATRSSGKARVKFVHDPIWGTIEVKPYEAAILDTQLLQRLRHIHQTGFVFQTYPSARHSRFEHTLGVMHAAGRMAEVLQKKYPKVVQEQAVQRVRLAALMHDTGHSAFSHTSEEVYSLCEDMLEFKQRNSRFSNSGGGEVLSYLITTSRSFRKFFATLKKQFGRDLKAEVDDFALLMTGKALKPQRYFEAEIISGPFDADKLDYFPRDGRSAGIQLALDTDRLFHCLELAKDPEDQKQKRQVLVVNRGGFNPLQQLLFARATLFATVYHHQKVRACDSMVKGCFEFWQESKTHKCVVGGKKRSLKSAADFLYLTDQEFFAQSEANASYPQQTVSNLLSRNLSKRVLVISNRTLRGFDGANTPVSYQQFRDVGSIPNGFRTLAERIRKAARVPCSKHEVWIDIPSRPNLDKAGGALIRENNGDHNFQRLATLIPVKQWVETYSQYFSQCLIFGPPNPIVRVKLCVAAYKVLQDDFGLRLKEQAFPEDIRKDVLMHLPKGSIEKILKHDFAPILVRIAKTVVGNYVAPTNVDSQRVMADLCAATRAKKADLTDGNKFASSADILVEAMPADFVTQGSIFLKSVAERLISERCSELELFMMNPKDDRDNPWGDKVRISVRWR